MALIAPSILTADLLELKEQLKAMEKEASWLHIDVMDGHFVQNISFGFPVIKSLRKHSSLFFDTHLMIERPEQYFERFAESGSNLVCFHAETAKNPCDSIKKIHGLGCKAGLALSNKVAAEKVFPFLDSVDLVLVMGVEAGFGAQSFIEKNLEKVKILKTRIEEGKLNVLVEVDGGVNAENGKRIIAAGADILVMGNSVFGKGNPLTNLIELKKRFSIE